MHVATHQGPEVLVRPDVALLDERIRIEVRGLDPGDRVTLRVEMTWGDTDLRAGAKFEVDEDGTVSTADDAPVAGPYEGVRPMGLFWALGPADDSSMDRSSVPEQLPTTVTLERDGEALGSVTVTRRSRAEGVERLDVAAADVPADLYVPAGEGPHPGVVLVGGSEGGRPRGVRPWLLASHGYAVLGPAYFGESGSPADHLAEVPVEAVERAVAWFADRDSVRPEPVGVVGSSRGSELGFLLASRLEAVRTVVGIAPSGVAFQGLREGFRPADTAAWAIDGDPVTYVPFAFSIRDMLSLGWDVLRASPIRLRGTYVDGLMATEPGRVAAAEIPVAETGGPVLLLAGEDDDLWASATLARRLRDRLEEAGFEHDVECRVYPDAGHAIGVPYLPTTHRSASGDGRIRLRLGGTPAGYAAADEAAWSAMLDTLERGLEDGGDGQPT